MLTRTCSYVSQCARARVTSTDKYGKTSQERRQRRFSSIRDFTENSSSLSFDYRVFFGDHGKRIRHRSSSDRRVDESEGFTNGRAEII